MREYVLFSGENIFRIGLNNKNLLVLSQGVGGQIIKNVPLTSHECALFSCDIDNNGILHIAAVTAKTLTYIKVNGELVNTTHLMRLPENFSITSVLINADTNLRLNYCVKSKDGCAVIEYVLTGDSWQGKNLYTTDAYVTLLCAKKGENKCYAVKKDNNLYMLINAYDSSEVFSSHFPIKYGQTLTDSVVFECGGSIYYKENEIAKGDSVFVLDGKRVLAKEGERIKEYILGDGTRFSGEVSMPRGAKEYVLCKACEDKKIIISSPFPYVKTELERVQNGGLMQEVYMQQRAVFALSAEVKALKERIRKLENDIKYGTSSLR